MSWYQVIVGQTSTGQRQDTALGLRKTAGEAERDLDNALARGFRSPEITRDGAVISEEQLRLDAAAERTFNAE